MSETKIPIPSQFVQMLPYVLAIVVLAGMAGKAMPPAANGKPYAITDQKLVILTRNKKSIAHTYYAEFYHYNLGCGCDLRWEKGED